MHRLSRPLVKSDLDVRFSCKECVNDSLHETQMSALMNSPDDVLNSIVTLMDPDTQCRVRFTCKRWKRIVDANSIFRQRKRLYWLYSKEHYDHLGYLVAKHPIHVEFVCGLLRREESIHRDDESYVLTNGELFIQRLSRVANWNCLQKATRFGIIEWRSRRDYQVTMEGAARGGNLPLFVRLHDEFRQRTFERCDNSICDGRCPEDCSFGSDLHWNDMCRRAIEGFNLDIIAICYGSSSRLNLHQLHAPLFLSGNVSLVRSYIENSNRANSWSRYLGWTSLEKIGTQAVEDMIEYLWKEEMEDDPSLTVWITLMNEGSGDDRGNVFANFDRRKKMYSKSK